jgi:hypothetical protein
MAAEGSCSLKNEKGEVLVPAEMLNNAVLEIEPFFYEGGQKTQTVGRCVTQGTKGAELKQIIRVTGDSGNVSTVKCDVKKKRVVPKFDNKQKSKTS